MNRSVNHKDKGLKEGCRTNLVKHNIGSMPGWEKDRTMCTISSPLAPVYVGVARGTVPSFERKTVDPTHTEERRSVRLILIRYKLWQRYSGQNE